MNLINKIVVFLFKRKIRGGNFLLRNFISGRRIEAVSKHGLRFSIDPEEYVDRFVLEHGFYEEEVLQSLLENLHEKDVFWDVGANLGLHALTVKKLMPSVSVYAFEPNPFLHRLMIATSISNKLKVNILPFALDEDKGITPFYIYKGNLGMSSLHKRGNNDNEQIINVEKAAGASLVLEGAVEKPNVMKIDAEGNELRILRGMKSFLSARQLHTIIFEDTNDQNTPVKTILQTAGFKIKKLHRKEPLKSYVDNYLAARD